MTSQPTNESELQLYRVLQRANLLSYYDTFIGQGGDDVQQLCEAGEEEFLEIMALVGMASKPLHVRRLQKALQEWVSNPGLFQTPFGPNHAMMLPVAANRGGPPPPHPMNTSTAATTAAVTPAGQHPSLPATHPSPPIPMLPNSNHHSSPSPVPKDGSIPSPSQASGGQLAIQPPQRSPGPQQIPMTEYGQPSSPLSLTPVLMDSQIHKLSESAGILVKTLPSFEPKPPNNKKKICKELEYIMSMPEEDPRRMEGIRKYAAIYGRFDCKRKPEKPLTLHEVSVNEAAAQICKHIPALLTRRDELFPLARQVVRHSGYQYSKGHSSLDWNSSAVNHSSSPNINHNNTNGINQPQAKQNSNNPWIQLLYGPNNNSRSQSTKYGDEEGPKRQRLDSTTRPEGSVGGRGAPVDPHVERQRRQERVENINEELKSISIQQEELKIQIQKAREVQDFSTIHQMQNQLEQLQNQQLQLFTEQSDLSKQVKRLDRYLATLVNHTNSTGNGRGSSCSDLEKPDTDDTDSQFSCSNASSPSHDNQDSSSQDANQQMADVFKASRKTNAQITKQLVQETLMDEGLRVVKEELASHIKDNNVPPPENVVRTSPSIDHHNRHQNHHSANVTVTSANCDGTRGSKTSPPSAVTMISNNQQQRSPMSLTNHHHPPPMKSTPPLVLPPPDLMGVQYNNHHPNSQQDAGVVVNNIKHDVIIEKNNPFLSDGCCIRNNNNNTTTDNSINALLNLQTKGNGIKQEPNSPTSLS